MSELGTQGNPHRAAPVDYGAFCRCRRCGRVDRSTHLFDYFADKPGDPLECQVCKFGMGNVTDEVRRVVDQDAEVRERFPREGENYEKRD